VSAPRDGNVYGVQAATGTKAWSFVAEAPVGSSPAVANCVVYIGSQFAAADNVLALDSSNGNRLWAFQTGGQVFSSPAVADGVVYVGSFDHSVYAFALPTG
jgi:eukaryotic-like serine/threonine-protein kinase